MDRLHLKNRLARGSQDAQNPSKSLRRVNPPEHLDLMRPVPQEASDDESMPPADSPDNGVVLEPAESEQQARPD
jgi:hypothetical protein